MSEKFTYTVIDGPAALRDTLVRAQARAHGNDFLRLGRLVAACDRLLAKDVRPRPQAPQPDKQTGWQQPPKPMKCAHLSALFAAVTIGRHEAGDTWYCGCGKGFQVVEHEVSSADRAHTAYRKTLEPLDD